VSPLQYYSLCLQPEEQPERRTVNLILSAVFLFVSESADTPCQQYLSLLYREANLHQFQCRVGFLLEANRPQHTKLRYGLKDTLHGPLLQGKGSCAPTNAALPMTYVGSFAGL